MDYATFNALVEKQLQACRDVLVPKGAEYSRNGERLHNFKRAAAQLGVTPEQALLGMEVKHRTSLLDMVDDVASGTLPSMAVLDEKVTDSINYLLLLKGLLSERMGVAYASPVKAD